MRRVSWSDPWHPAFLISDQRGNSRQDMPITKQGEEVTDNTAIGALRKRIHDLELRIVRERRDYDNHANFARIYERNVKQCVAEIDSINAAIELLEAADDYSSMSAGPKEES